jgi:transcription initiation factor TFIIH subunit 4
VALTKNFRASLRLALTGGGEHQSFGVPSNDSAAVGVDGAFLDEYARVQWEGILHYVVNSVGEFMRNGGDGGPTASVKQLLEAGKLVTKGRHSGGGITQAGFSFLLQEVNAQVWTLLLLWIENADQV